MYTHFTSFPSSLSPDSRTTSRVTENSREKQRGSEDLNNKYKVIEKRNEKVEQKRFLKTCAPSTYALSTCALGFSSGEAHASQGQREGFIGVAGSTYTDITQWKFLEVFGGVLDDSLLPRSVVHPAVVFNYIDFIES